MAEQIANLPHGVDICFETFGSADDPTVLLVMGLGGPMGWWTNAFCGQLIERGFHVVRYDNRDTGRSTKFSDSPVAKADLIKAFLGRPIEAPYRLNDMADDAFALLDHLGVESAHVAGVSMGGMIAQTLAISRPERVLSLTSIMSTTGNRRVGYQHPVTFPSLLAPAKGGREEYVARSLKSAALIGSPAFPTDRAESIARAEETYDRGWTGEGVARHMAAVTTQDDRTAALGKLTIPATVIHGLRDKLVDISGGRATARAIPHAEFVSIPGMGHDIPTQLFGTFIDAIERTAKRSITTR
ncbi:MAG: alpha/beta hydrolase [Nocardioidaceae bacterium]|nr:alpha/beta hydrolase [Nocardioidaceae bacterium]